MSTNVNVYFPNVSELEAFKAWIRTKPMVLGIYRNPVVPDGNTIVSTLTELATGGGRGYAQKALVNQFVEDVRTADKWYVASNASGKAEGAYDDDVLTWTFNAFDVADGYSAYGVFAYSWVLPFDTGGKEIKVGDTIKGASSSATGIVTGVSITSGTWAAGTAAGYLDIYTKTGTFVDGENIYVAGEVATLVAAPTAAGDLYSVGDTFKITTGGEGCIGTVMTLTGGDNSPVATINVNPGAGGRNYTVGAGKVTAKLTGGGNDALTVEIATLATVAYAVTNTGVIADAHQRLLAVWAFSSAIAIETEGQTITWDHKVAFASG